MIAAKVVADSVSASGVRLTTLQLKYHRFIHGEFMTHRLFSRNASSSRAVPVAKEIERVRTDPAMPVHWGKNQPGMQAKEEVSQASQVLCSIHWRGHAAQTTATVEGMVAQHGLHKQVANRLLEPFQWIDVVVTATEWDNFFNLRDHDDVQPEIRELARRMRDAMAASTPRLLHPGQWHMPYVDLAEITREYSGGSYLDWNEGRKLSIARCARASYRNHDGSACIAEKDIALHDTLLASRHLSPFEHVCTPMERPEGVGCGGWEEGVTHKDRAGRLWSGNIRGFIQHRQLVDAWQN